MNERIQELSAIAKNLATDEAIHLGRIHNRTLSLDEEQEIFTKKFAELIVEECRYVMDCNKGSDQHTEWNRALSETSNKILEHFGVEE